MAKEKASIGLAGEFFVLAELFRRGYQASLTFGNTKKIDIFAESPNGKTIKIQVKTTSKFPKNKIHSKWQVGRKTWEISPEEQENLYFIFVLLNEPPEAPIYHIAKAKDVIEQTKESFKKWSDEIESGKIKYRGGLTKKEREDYNMKDFYSEQFEKKYSFIDWDQMFD